MPAYGPYNPAEITYWICFILLFTRQYVGMFFFYEFLFNIYLFIIAVCVTYYAVMQLQPLAITISL